METRFVDDEELIGRTVKTVIAGDHCIVIGFTDGTYTQICYGGGYYPGEGEMYFNDDTLNEKETAAIQRGGFIPSHEVY